MIITLRMQRGIPDLQQLRNHGNGDFSRLLAADAGDTYRAGQLRKRGFRQVRHRASTFRNDAASPSNRSARNRQSHHASIPGDKSRSPAHGCASSPGKKNPTGSPPLRARDPGIQSGIHTGRYDLRKNISPAVDPAYVAIDSGQCRNAGRPHVAGTENRDVHAALRHRFEEHRLARHIQAACNGKCDRATATCPCDNTDDLLRDCGYARSGNAARRYQVPVVGRRRHDHGYSRPVEAKQLVEPTTTRYRQFFRTGPRPRRHSIARGRLREESGAGNGPAPQGLAKRRRPCVRTGTPAGRRRWIRCTAAV